MIFVEMGMKGLENRSHWWEIYTDTGAEELMTKID